MPRIDPDEDQAKKKLNPAAPAAAPTKTPSAAPAVMQAMGLNPSNVSPADLKAPALETNPMPNTNAAAKEMGLGETDVAPGVSPPQPVAPVAPPNPIVPETAVAQAQSVKPIVQPSNTGTTSVGPITAETSGGTGSIKEASSTPGFWQQALDVAGKAGKSLIELIGDFAAGYSHQQSSPTEQRIAREHELRLQGNEMQAHKDLLGIQQGFQKQQADLDRAFQNKWNATKDVNEKAKLKQDYDFQTQSLRNQSLQIQNQYAIEQLNQRLMIAGKQGTTGSFSALFGGE